MVLSKTDMGIASRYAQLVEDVKVREEIFGMIETEWERTTSTLMKINKSKTLLSDNPTMARSLNTRLPYIDPLNHLQVMLLERTRAGEDDKKLTRALHITINGIAAGLRNSG
jgi:phosphoenolpyruvate carboxylase